jgi:dienelactone hydrolase
MKSFHSIFDEHVQIDSGDPRIGVLNGTLSIPERAWSAVVFAQGGGGSCECPYADVLATALQDVGLATLLVDLYSSAEERAAERTSKHRVDIGLMTDRLRLATDWLNVAFAENDFRIGYLGAGAGAAAVLKAAAEQANVVAAVSCDGLPALAGRALTEVTAATLLIVGERERAVIDWNVAAFDRLSRAFRRELAIVPNASHPLSGDEAVNEAKRLVSQWFVRYLGAAKLQNPNQEAESSFLQRGFSMRSP